VDDNHNKCGVEQRDERNHRNRLPSSPVLEDGAPSLSSDSMGVRLDGGQTLLTFSTTAG